MNSMLHREVCVLILVVCLNTPSIYGQKTYAHYVTDKSTGQEVVKHVPFGLQCEEGSGLRLEIPMKAYEGPQGPPGPQGLPGPRGIPGAAGKACQIAFYAALSGSHEYTFTQNPPLIMDKLITNVGGGYDFHSGQFTAPTNATYSFRVTVSAQEEKKGAARIYLNGKWMGTIWADSIGSWGSATNTYILSMKTGDKVYLLVDKRAPHLYASLYTSFSGWCMWED